MLNRWFDFSLSRHVITTFTSLKTYSIAHIIFPIPAFITHGPSFQWQVLPAYYTIKCKHTNVTWRKYFKINAFVFRNFKLRKKYLLIVFLCMSLTVCCSCSICGVPGIKPSSKLNFVPIRSGLFFFFLSHWIDLRNYFKENKTF